VFLWIRKSDEAIITYQGGLKAGKRIPEESVIK